MQLDLFNQLPDKDDILTEKANNLLEALNDGRKKDLYLPYLYTQIGNLIVLIACTKNNDMVGNILDLDGNTPKGFSVNWRYLSLIKQELLEHCYE